MSQPPKDLYTDYEKLLLKNVRLYSKRIQRLYNDAIVEISLSASTISYTGKTFTLDLYPSIKAKIDKILAEMQKEMLATINQATRKAWDISNKKNDIVTKAVLGKRSLPAGITDKFFNPNLKAYEAFSKRSDKGLNLSQRIWNLLHPFKHELEAGLADGINNGRSATSMAADMKRYLNEPDKLFRRVRDEYGKLQLSKAAQAYHPGQGVYRSSHKNAMRLTRTETNMSYRNADHERWLTMPFVTGFEIKLSKSHPKYDICDSLAGKYPKQFNWAGWHPQCLCFEVPILASDEQFNALEDEILGINTKPAVVKQITEMPQAFKDYYAKNKERIKGWKNPPYWVKDNPQFLAGNVPVNYRSPATLKENVSKLLFREKDYGTDRLFADIQNGGWEVKRLNFHKDLVAEYLKDESTKLGTSYFLGGAPATGKSSIIDSGFVKLPKGILTVDPDKIKAMIPEYNEMVRLGNTAAAHKVHEESSSLAKSVVKSAAMREYDIVSDGVGDGSYKSIVDKVDIQRKAGKKVIANYVTTDTEVSVKRATDRAKQTGREVPEEYIRSMHKEISKLLPNLAKNAVFDELRLFNNDGAKPILVFEQIGKKITVYNQRLYDKFLKQAK